AGGCLRSRTKIRVQASPSGTTVASPTGPKSCAVIAAPSVIAARSVIAAPRSSLLVWSSLFVRSSLLVRSSLVLEVEMAFERVQVVRPETPVRRQPRVQLPERAGLEPVDALLRRGARGHH